MIRCPSGPAFTPSALRKVAAGKASLPPYFDPIIVARQQFADANGWRVSKFFALRDLVAPLKGIPLPYFETDFEQSAIVDHAECFRKDRKPVAIVGHNYDGHGLQYGWERIAEFCAPLGLLVHVAPAGKVASWYYPGHSTLLVITQPGIEVVWPTAEQMVKNAERRALYLESVRQRDERRELRRRVESNFGAPHH
jgi:hypothetical protein